jgi:hypothetical protein
VLWTGRGPQRARGHRVHLNSHYPLNHYSLPPSHRPQRLPPSPPRRPLGPGRAGRRKSLHQRESMRRQQQQHDVQRATARRTTPHSTVHATGCRRQDLESALPWRETGERRRGLQPDSTRVTYLSIWLARRNKQVGRTRHTQSYAFLSASKVARQRNLSSLTTFLLHVLSFTCVEALVRQPHISRLVCVICFEASCTPAGASQLSSLQPEADHIETTWMARTTARQGI